MPKHRIEMALPVNLIMNADARFVVFSDDQKLGELHISRGTIDWWPGKKQKGRRLSWEQFDRLMDEQGRTI